MLLTGADIVTKALELEGVDTVFGYPGGQALPLYDALYKTDIRHILTRHEQGAAHAADGYARVTGKPGVCISTSGPGATNLVTGIANAHMDSIPVVFITCQVPRDVLGKDSFQEADISGITTPITKHNFMVRSIDRLPRILRKAFHIATTGRPGPVVIDIPKDVLVGKLDFEYPEKVTMPGYKDEWEGNIKNITDLADAFSWAQKPVLFIGGGALVAESTNLLEKLVEKTEAPIVASLMGLSAFPTNHPLHLGMVGMHGTYTANMAVTNCDLIIGIGVRYDDRVTGIMEKFAPNARIAHMDVDKAEINKNVKTDYKVYGDLRWSLPHLLELVENGNISPWIEQIRSWQKYHCLYDVEQDTKLLKPQIAIARLNEILKGEAIICTDVGQHQMWTAQYMDFIHPRSFVSSGGLGTMGFGLPAAIGAQFGQEDKEVWLISGDGSFMMNCQEIATASEWNLPIRCLILDNRGLGMVRQWQRLFFGNRYSHSKHAKTDFVKLAEAMGGKGFNADNEENLVAAINKARKVDGPAFIDARVEDDEDVVPMVAPGKTLDKMLLDE